MILKRQAGGAQHLRMAARVAGETGLTLLEMIITIVVTAVLAGLMAKLLSAGVDTYDFVSSRKDALQSARVGVQVIAKELRQIVLPDSIVEAKAEKIQFYKKKAELVSIAREVDKVLLNDNTLIPGVTQFSLQYYDDQGILLDFPISNLANIFRIRFEVRVSRNNHEIRFSHEVEPRNF